MSGGHFDYDQYKIGYMADSIEKEIRLNGKKKERDEFQSWEDEEYIKRWPETEYHRKYEERTIKRFKEAIRYLRMAEIYAHRVDWFLSGDDGEESFHRRLEEELKRYSDNLENY